MRPASLVFALFFTSYAFAAKAPEVYSAIEDESGTQSLSAPAPESVPVSPVSASRRSKAAQSVSKNSQKKARSVATQQQTAAPAAASAATYDAVPAAQAQAVAQRLKLIETLIVRHGRAYDYRALTLKDLEKLVAELDHGKSTGLASDPAAATSRVPAEKAEAADSLPTSQAAAEIVDEEKSLPEIPPPAYHDDAGSLAPGAGTSTAE